MEQTATRATLDPAWIAAQAQVDWMAAPYMAEYVNGLVSGRSLADQGHWALHALRQHIAPLAEKRGGSLSMLSLGCGNAHIERALIEQFGWPIKRLVGYEYDSALREAAGVRFASLGIDSQFEFFDFNAPPKPAQFDLLFCCHALHHATDVEAALAFAAEAIAPGGFFIGIEYLGPTRFQIEYDVLPHIRTLFSLLPAELRRNLSKGGLVEDQFEPPTLRDVREADPSESARSSDLRTLLLSAFPIVELKPMGGTLLRWLLQYRAGNFRHDHPEHIAIARLLQAYEKNLILSRQIRSDDLFFVLKGPAG